MTILIILICVLISAILLTAAFFLSKYVVKITLRNEQLEKDYKHIDDKEKIELIMRKELLETNYKIAEDYIKGLEDRIETLSYTVDQQNYETQMKNQHVRTPRIWNPNDMLNSEERS